MINWETLITEGNGKISLHRVRKMSAIVMGWIGAGVLLVGAMTTDVELDKLALIAAVLVAPMTGGQIADAISGKFLADKIQSGQAPGRRSTDVDP